MAGMSFGSSSTDFGTTCADSVYENPTAPVDSLYFHVGVVPGVQRIFLEVVKSKVTDYLAVFDRQPDDSFARTFVFEDVPPQIGQTYQWHVDEYNDQARLVAATTVPGSFVIVAPKVAGAPFVWPTAPNHYIFAPWTIPGFVAVQTPQR